MKKYFPLLITTCITMAFVVVKKSVIPALPGIEKIIKVCPSELDANREQLLKPEDRQAREDKLNKDTLTSFIFIRQYTFQKNKKHDYKQKNYFSYRRYGRAGEPCDLVPDCIK